MGTLSADKTSFVQRAMATYQETPVNIKVLPVKLIRFERKDLIELKWVSSIVNYCFVYLLP